jgi:hypothetical protein
MNSTAVIACMQTLVPQVGRVSARWPELRVHWQERAIEFRSAPVKRENVLFTIVAQETLPSAHAGMQPGPIAGAAG